jgi:hypothetical protein
MLWKVFTSWNLHNMIQLSMRSYCTARQLEKTCRTEDWASMGDQWTSKYLYITNMCPQDAWKALRSVSTVACVNHNASHHQWQHSACVPWLLHSDAGKYYSFLEYDTMLIGNLQPIFQTSLVALSSFFLDYHEEGSRELLQKTGSKLPIYRVS